MQEMETASMQQSETTSMQDLMVSMELYLEEIMLAKETMEEAMKDM